MSVVNNEEKNQMVVKKDDNIKVLLQFQKFFTDKYAAKASIVFAELAYLSQNIRSCRVFVNNQTQYIIRSVSHRILGRCKLPGGVESSNIKPNSHQAYLYEKADFSPKGCAGIQTFTVDLSTSLKLSFLVAFRNYTVQIRKPSKVVILRMNETWDCDEADIDIRSFDEIMKNEDKSPTFKLLHGYYESDKPIFYSLVAGARSAIHPCFDNIKVGISMTSDHRSTVEVHISTKPANERDTEL